MKGTFFSKPLEWNIETEKESWTQGDLVRGILRVRNHGAENLDLNNSGVGLAFADIKKVHARTDGAMKFDGEEVFKDLELKSGEEKQLPFSLQLPPNSGVTDKKASYFLTYGKNYSENHLMLKVEPRVLFAKVVSLLDTFQRFKLKEYKCVKDGVEYKLIPPTSRDMANLESLNLTFSMKDENLVMDYEFLVRKLDTEGVVNKINKVGVKIKKSLSPKEFSLGKDMINQDALLKSIEGTLGEVKLKAVF